MWAKYVPLILQENVILPPFHIKLDLMKHFVKAITKNVKGFLYLKSVVFQINLLQDIKRIDVLYQER